MNHSDKKRIIFFGTPRFASQGLQTLLSHEQIEVGMAVTQPDKPAGRGGDLRASEVKTLAEANNIPVLQPGNMRKELTETFAAISGCGPFDLGIVIAFGQILPKEILQLPFHGCVNVHASLLPRWRGAAPIQRAILSGDAETGVCLMEMDEGLDTGGVYSSEKVKISAGDTFQTLHDKLAITGAQLLKRDILKILGHKLRAAPQPEVGVTYAAKIKPEEGKIDWHKSAEEISRLIRALAPMPGAFCIFKDKRLKIFRARVHDMGKINSESGKIKFTDRNTLEVYCAEGVLSLEELQLEGKKRMPVSEFLNGMPLKAGINFE